MAYITRLADLVPGLTFQCIYQREGRRYTFTVIKSYVRNNQEKVEVLYGGSHHTINFDDLQEITPC